MSRFAALILPLLAGASLVASQVYAAQPKPSSGPSTVFVTPAEWQSIRNRKQAFSDVLAGCSQRVDFQPSPIAILSSPRKYTATGDAGNRADQKILPRDANQAYRFAICYQVTRDTRYAATAQRIVDAWAHTLKGVAAHNDQGNLNFQMPLMILAADWVRGVNGWKTDDFDKFLRTFVIRNSESSNENNHGMWGVLLETSSYAYLGDAAGLAKARTRWGEILRGATSADGTLIREIQRSDTSNFAGGATKGIRGLAYANYFLVPASVAAKIFADAGMPLWDSPDGQVLARTYAKTAGWVEHPETFPFYAANGGKLQDTNGASYIPILLKHYPSADAVAVLKRGNIAPDAFLTTKLF